MSNFLTLHRPGAEHKFCLTSLTWLTPRTPQGSPSTATTTTRGGA